MAADPAARRQRSPPHPNTSKESAKMAYNEARQPCLRHPPARRPRAAARPHCARHPHPRRPGPHPCWWARPTPGPPAPLPTAHTAGSVGSAANPTALPLACAPSRCAILVLFTLLISSNSRPAPSRLHPLAASATAGAAALACLKHLRLVAPCGRARLQSGALPNVCARAPPPSCLGAWAWAVLPRPALKGAAAPTRTLIHNPKPPAPERRPRPPAGPAHRPPRARPRRGRAAGAGAGAAHCAAHRPWPVGTIIHCQPRRAAFLCCTPPARAPTQALPGAAHVAVPPQRRLDEGELLGPGWPPFAW
jgi:hypothetical protein